MKNNRIVILTVFGTLLIAATLYSVNGFLKCDEKLYYYGINRLDRYEPINDQIIPINGFVKFNSFGNPFYNSVELWDKDDCVTVGEGVSYNHYADIVVDSLVSYGFNDTCVVAEFVAKDRQHYYVMFDESNIATVKCKNFYGNISPQNHFHLYTWIPNVNCPPQKLITIHRLFESGSIIGGGITFVLFIFTLIILIKATTSKKQSSFPKIPTTTVPTIDVSNSMYYRTGGDPEKGRYGQNRNDNRGNKNKKFIPSKNPNKRN